MDPKVSCSPFLTFQGKQAEQALRFYVSTIPDSHIDSIEFYADGEAGPAGTVKMAHATVGGLKIMATDSWIKHAWEFNPGISLFVNFTEEPELERVANCLATGGKILMDIGEYGFPGSIKFGWVADRWGVNWQLNLA